MHVNVFACVRVFAYECVFVCDVELRALSILS